MKWFFVLILSFNLNAADTDPAEIEQQTGSDCCSYLFRPCNSISHPNSTVCCGCFNKITGQNSEVNWGCFNHVAADNVDGMDDQEAADAVIDRVAERQHAGLAEQDVVGQREDDRDADQAERGQGTAGAEHFRQHQQEDRGCNPESVELELLG